MKKNLKNTPKNKNTLYTGIGDNGTTTLYHCEQGRISKSSNIIEALGQVDELNAYLGIVKVHSDTNEIRIAIGDIQQSLFVVQAELGGSKISIDKKVLTKIEKIINKVGKVLPPITSFTISGGSLLSAELDFTRTLARKAERGIIKVQEEGFRTLNKNTITYMNRLSTLLFALSRYSNYLLEIPEDHPKYNKK